MICKAFPEAEDLLDGLSVGAKNIVIVSRLLIADDPEQEISGLIEELSDESN